MEQFQYRLNAKIQNGSAVIFNLLPAKDSPALTKFIPGQHVLLSFVDENKQVVGPRAFTICNTPNPEGFIQLCIKVYQNVTKKIADLPENSTILLSGPIGHFQFDFERDQKAVFIAGGSGVTPFVSFIRYIVENNLNNNIIMLYSNKKSEDIMFRQEMEDLDQERENLKFHFTLTDEVPAHWGGDTTRIDAEMLRKYCSPLEEKIFYLCGPLPFMDAMEETLAKLGIAENLIIKP